MGLHKLGDYIVPLGNDPRQTGTANVFNVRDFGAGSSSGDDSVAIQAAVNKASSQGGGTVYIPAGAYSITATITIPNFINILGDGSVSILTVTGNIFCFAFSPGNRARISNLLIQASSVQAGGGAIDYAAAVLNIWVDHIWLGSNLFIGFNMCPTTNGVGAWYVHYARSFGSASIGTMIKVAPVGAVGVSDIHFTDCEFTAGTTSDLTNAIVLNTGATGLIDTFFLTDVSFYRGVNGITVSGTSPCTGTKFFQVLLDTFTTISCQLANINDLQWIGGGVNTSGNSSNPGISIGASAKSVSLNGLTLINCGFTGIDVNATATHTKILGCTISDCNTTNTANGDGIRIAANATDFVIIGNTVANSLLTALGHIKTCINIVAGTSDRYYVVGNMLIGGETAQQTDGGSGISRFVVSKVGAVTQGALTVTQAAATAAASQVSFGNQVGTTVGAAGPASALPATPTGYLQINVAGTLQRIPYYA